MSKAKGLSLDEFLEHDNEPKRKLTYISREVRKPVEVVLFWTDWTCACGRHYEMPTYGDTLTLYEIYRGNRLYAKQYEHYLPACHADLPRRIEARHISIPHCLKCLHEEVLQCHQN